MFQPEKMADNLTRAERRTADNRLSEETIIADDLLTEERLRIRDFTLPYSSMGLTVLTLVGLPHVRHPYFILPYSSMGLSVLTVVGLPHFRPPDFTILCYTIGICVLTLVGLRYLMFVSLIEVILQFIPEDLLNTFSISFSRVLAESSSGLT